MCSSFFPGAVLFHAVSGALLEIKGFGGWRKQCRLPAKKPTNGWRLRDTGTLSTAGSVDSIYIFISVKDAKKHRCSLKTFHEQQNALHRENTTSNIRKHGTWSLSGLAISEETSPSYRHILKKIHMKNNVKQPLRNKCDGHIERETAVMEKHCDILRLKNFLRKKVAISVEKVDVVWITCGCFSTSWQSISHCTLLTLWPVKNFFLVWTAVSRLLCFPLADGHLCSAHRLFLLSKMLLNEKLREAAVLCAVSELVKEIFVGAEVFKSLTFRLELHSATSLNLVSYRGLKTGSCVWVWSCHCVGWMYHVSRDSGCLSHHLHKTHWAAIT